MAVAVQAFRADVFEVIAYEAIAACARASHRFREEDTPQDGTTFYKRHTFAEGLSSSLADDRSPCGDDGDRLITRVGSFSSG